VLHCSLDASLLAFENLPNPFLLYVLICSSDLRFSALAALFLQCLICRCNVCFGFSTLATLFLQCLICASNVYFGPLMLLSFDKVYFGPSRSFHCAFVFELVLLFLMVCFVPIEKVALGWKMLHS
jgi:hypothetical protein